MASALAWSWRNAVHGVVLALPAGVAMLSDAHVALALAVGVLPAAALGVSSRRRQRAAGLLVGGIAGAALLLGSIVATIPGVAVATILILCVVVALLTVDDSHRLAAPVLMLGVPLLGAGFSFTTVSSGLAAACLIVLGSLYAFLVSLVWPDRSPPERPKRPATTRSAMLVYGIQIGVAGAIAAAIGFALGVDHPGWAATAALLVSRPVRAAAVARGWGRAISVVAGAALACTVAAIAPPSVVVAVLLVVVLALGTGTAGSRWYVFPFFSTFIVLSMLLLDDSELPSHWFVERVGMTVIGVALALAAAVIVPRIGRALLDRGGRGSG